MDTRINLTISQQITESSRLFVYSIELLCQKILESTRRLSTLPVIARLTGRHQVQHIIYFSFSVCSFPSAHGEEVINDHLVFVQLTSAVGTVSFISFKYLIADILINILALVSHTIHPLKD